MLAAACSGCALVTDLSSLESTEHLPVDAGPTGPSVIAAAQASPDHLAVFEGHLYWTAGNELRRATTSAPYVVEDVVSLGPLGPFAGTPGVVDRRMYLVSPGYAVDVDVDAFALHVITVTGGTAFAVDGDTVYAGADGRLRMLAAGASSWVDRSIGITGPEEMVRGASFECFTQGGTDVDCVGDGATTPAPVDGTTAPRGLSTDGESLYWIDVAAGALLANDVTVGSATRVLASGLERPTTTTVRAGRIFYATADAVRSCRLPGCDDVTIHAPLAAASVSSLAADDSLVYFADQATGTVGSAAWR